MRLVGPNEGKPRFDHAKMRAYFTEKINHAQNKHLHESGLGTPAKIEDRRGKLKTFLENYGDIDEIYRILHGALIFPEDVAVFKQMMIVHGVTKDDDVNNQWSPVIRWHSRDRMVPKDWELLLGLDMGASKEAVPNSDVGSERFLGYLSRVPKEKIDKLYAYQDASSNPERDTGSMYLTLGYPVLNTDSFLGFVLLLRKKSPKQFEAFMRSYLTYSLFEQFQSSLGQPAAARLLLAKQIDEYVPAEMKPLFEKGDKEVDFVAIADRVERSVSTSVESTLRETLLETTDMHPAILSRQDDALRQIADILDGAEHRRMLTLISQDIDGFIDGFISAANSAFERKKRKAKSSDSVHAPFSVIEGGKKD